MDYNQKTLIVISGPNGAGKSTHIQTMLPDELVGLTSFDRDQTRILFEKQLRKDGVSEVLITPQATRKMEEKLLVEMKSAIALQASFVLETPLSHPDYWRYIDLFEDAGYQIQLSYLCLDKISDCLSRVDQRVSEGGHYVKPEIIKGVFNNNLINIDNQYTTFQRIELYDGMLIPRLLCCVENNEIEYISAGAKKKIWITKGLPSFCVHYGITKFKV